MGKDWLVMVDPQVEQLADKLVEQVKDLNNTWLELQNHNVSASLIIDGGYSNDSVQTLKIHNIKQIVEYLNTSRQ